MRVPATGCTYVSAAIGLAIALGLAAPIEAADPARAIFVMKLDGTQLRRLAEVEGFNKHGSPHWSHDGRRLAFDVSGPGGAQKSLVVDVDGKGLQSVGDFVMPRWSPDDKQLAFHNWRGLWVQNVDGKGRERLADGFCPRWSPDGSQILYSTWRGLAILDLVNGEERPLLADAFKEILRGMDWSPDGRHVAFVGRRDGPRELWIADAAPDQHGLRLRLSGAGNERRLFT